MNEFDFLGFDENEELDASQFTRMPDGIYRFDYCGYTPGNHTPDQFDHDSYPTAVVKIKLHTPEGDRDIDHTFKMLREKSGMIGSFFRSLGAPKNPQTGKVKPGWNSMIGRSGVLELKTRKFKGQDGQEREFQNKNFLDPESREAKSAEQAAPVQAAPTAWKF